MKRYELSAALLAALVLTGCSKPAQVHDKGYVRAAAVSGINGKAAAFSFYGEAVDPLTASGNDFTQLVEEAELKSGKELFTGHTELIILGKCNYTEVLEHLLNEWRVSPSCLVVYSEGFEVYNIRYRDTHTLAASVRTAVRQGKVPECDIITVLSSLLDSGRSAELPLIGENGIEGTCTIS